MAAPATAAVTIAGLMIDGFNKLATNGIVVTRARAVVIKDCALKNFAQTGITVSGVGTNFLIENIVTTGNGTQGIWVNQTLGAPMSGIINRVTSTDNLNQGIYIQGLFQLGDPATIVSPKISITEALVSKKRDRRHSGDRCYRHNIAFNRNAERRDGVRVIPNNPTGAFKSTGDNNVSLNSPDFNVASTSVAKF